METLYEALTYYGMPVTSYDQVMEQNEWLQQQVELLYGVIEDMKHRHELEIELESIEVEIPLPPKKRMRM
jgi:hypothetical protein